MNAPEGKTREHHLSKSPKPGFAAKTYHYRTRTIHTGVSLFFHGHSFFSQTAIQALLVFFLLFYSWHGCGGTWKKCSRRGLFYRDVTGRRVGVDQHAKSCRADWMPAARSPRVFLFHGIFFSCWIGIICSACRGQFALFISVPKISYISPSLSVHVTLFVTLYCGCSVRRHGLPVDLSWRFGVRDALKFVWNGLHVTRDVTIVL